MLIKKYFGSVAIVTLVAIAVYFIPFRTRHNLETERVARIFDKPVPLATDLRENKPVSTERYQERTADRLEGNAALMAKLRTVLKKSKPTEKQLDRVRTDLAALIGRYRPELVLSDSEFKILVIEVADFMLASGELKAEQARPTLGPDGSIKIDIPARPALAVQLAKMFQEDLAIQLTKERADAIDDYLGHDLLQGSFDGYGAADEKYSFTPLPGEGGRYAFSYQSKISPEVEASYGAFLEGFFGTELSQSSVELEKILELPQYSFLRKIIKK